jgi:hypothetical protein
MSRVCRRIQSRGMGHDMSSSVFVGTKSSGRILHRDVPSFYGGDSVANVWFSRSVRSEMIVSRVMQDRFNPGIVRIDPTWKFC